MKLKKQKNDSTFTPIDEKGTFLVTTDKIGGTYIGMNEKDKKKIYCVIEDTHTICIGATRCGKTRCNVLETECALALAGESMIFSDPKGELYLYSYPFLERLGYEVIALDFKNPRKSNRYNFLQPVIDAINENKTALAISRARDIVASLVSSDTKGERIWTDGERSILLSGIMAVVYDNKERPEFQNLTNVYHFLAKMCKPIGKEFKMPIVEYLKGLDEDHPARATIDISEIAPSKMRGSFYTSALVTLSLFTDPELYDMTCLTDFDTYSTGSKKRAIFMILPDHKETYYSIASLFVYQHYQTLVDSSDKNGNRLSNRVNFVLDEFGNFTKIPNFATLITVGGGRGIRFSLYLQDFNQLDSKYGEKEGKIIRSNAETWIYLQTDDDGTLQELSRKLGKYTVKSPSLSSSTGGQNSASYNFTARDLLTPDEIRRISRPYQLITSRNDPAVMYAPDISETIFNEMLGLGDENHNIEVIKIRQQNREEREEIDIGDIKLWGIWNYYIRMLEMGKDAVSNPKNAVIMNEKVRVN